MNTTDYDWLEKRTPRSIDQLRLWNENPRLNPEETHLTIVDFTEDMISDETEKKHFFDLLKSLANEYIPADPIVVWQESNQKYYVAEGNRRVLALKLLKNPDKAPKSIRAYVRRISENRKIRLEKINVCVAPTFEDAEWYINQRNSASSLQLQWSRIQQQRWIDKLYKKYGNDIETLLAKTNMSQGELENYIRNLRLIDLIRDQEIRSVLNEQQYKDATSHNFPITVLERFFSNKLVKEKWGIEFDGLEIKLKNRKGFLTAYAELIRNIVDNQIGIQIDTRTITSDLDTILEKLPSVDLSEEDPFAIREKPSSEINRNTGNNLSEDKPKVILKGDLNRNRLILPFYLLETSNYRLEGIFNELKNMPISKYPNAAAASIRIFLDLSVLNWLISENKLSEIKKKYNCDLREIVLKNRLTFVGETLCNSNKKASSIITKLLNPSNEYSLDVLNGFQHSNDSCYLNKQFINGFWDFLFPLFEILLDIKENSLQDE